MYTHGTNGRKKYRLLICHGFSWSQFRIFKINYTLDFCFDMLKGMLLWDITVILQWAASMNNEIKWKQSFKKIVLNFIMMNKTENESYDTLWRLFYFLYDCKIIFFNHIMVQVYCRYRCIVLVFHLLKQCFFTMHAISIWPIILKF